MEYVNHPKHYNSHPNGIECIDIIRHYVCDIANAIKYLWRAGLKVPSKQVRCDACIDIAERKEARPTAQMGMEDAEKEIEDLKKALWYIEDYMANCSGETCADAARPSMRSWVRLVTGHTVKKICEGYHSDIAKAIELLTMVGLVKTNGIVRVYHWKQYLESAMKCIQKHIINIEVQLLNKETENTVQVLRGQAFDGEDYVSKPGRVRETEPEHYDPLNMIVAWGRVYSLTDEVRKKPNGALYSPCAKCDLIEVCYDDWRHPDTSVCHDLCRLHQAKTNEYYREVGIVKYSPRFGTVEVVEESNPIKKL